MSGHRAIVIAGTDTGVGKTIFAAALASALRADYWKPVQAGLDRPTDSETVAALGGLHGGPHGGLHDERIRTEAYRLATAASPHRAAELDDLEIDPARLQLPPHQRALVIELAGGLMVPLTRSVLQIDVVAQWRMPVVLVARTSLGTINHSLLSIEALRGRGVEIAGIAFVGEENVDSEEVIAAIGGVKRLGRLPVVSPLTAENLASAFAENFVIGDFS
ncbi:MAG: dethiobiotin synthase [Alphaproteobacteria bacterium]|nr:dethiobiotin synthase [Alphaproteobacteria bacterium]